MAKSFVRTAAVKVEVRLPIFCPGLDRYKGDTPPSSMLPDNWVHDGTQGRHIFDELLAMDEEQFVNNCRTAFNKRKHGPIKYDLEHKGFADMTRVSINSFHEDAAGLWQPRPASYGDPLAGQDVWFLRSATGHDL